MPLHGGTTGQCYQISQGGGRWSAKVSHDIVFLKNWLLFGIFACLKNRFLANLNFTSHTGGGGLQNKMGRDLNLAKIVSRIILMTPKKHKLTIKKNSVIN